MIYDGTNAVSLDLTSYLIQNESGFGDPTAFIYPAKVNSRLKSDIMSIGTERIKQQVTPGIYQALFVVTGGVHFEQVRQLPLAEQSFLAKVLNLDLVDISLKLAQSQCDVNQLEINLVNNKIWAFSAAFPFRSLGLHDETIQSETIIGAEMAYGHSITDALKQLSPNGEDSIHNGTYY
jgi:carbamoyl-phosphate synthase large subunit